MASLIVLLDRRSHTIVVDGREHRFQQNKPVVTSDERVIAICKRASKSMFSVTDDIEGPKPPKKAEGEDAAPAEASEASDASSEDTTAEAEKPSRRSPKRRKVKVDDDE